MTKNNKAVWLFSLIILHVYAPLLFSQNSNNLPHTFEFNEIRYLKADKGSFNLAYAINHLRQFTPSSTRDLNLGVASDDYWISFEWKHAAKSQDAFVVFENPRLNLVDLYIIENDSLINSQSFGDYLPFDNRPVHANPFIIPLHLKATKAYTFIALLKHKGNTLQVPIRLMDNNSLVTYLQHSMVFMGASTGIMLLAAAFGIFFFLNSRTDLYVYYTLYALSLALWHWSTEGYAFQFLWPNIPLLATKVGPAMSIISGGFFGLSCVSFCRTYDASSIARKALLYYSAAFVAIGLIMLMPFVDSTEPIVMSRFLKIHFLNNFLLILLLAFYLLKVSIKQNKMALYYFGAVITSMLFSILLMARHSGLLDLTFNSGTFMMSGILIEILLMTMGISIQLYGYKREKDAMQIAYLQQQQELNLRIIETQHNERIRISRELHDDIGAGLTIIQAASAGYSKVEHPAEILTKINERSKQMALKLKDIIWSMTNDSMTLNQLCSYLRQEIGDMLDYTKMEPTFDFSFEKGEVVLSKNLCRTLILINKEAANNAIKHSDATEFRVSISTHHHQLTMVIQDNGKGLDASLSTSGNGLRNFAIHCNHVGGTFEIVHQAEGTKLHFSFPMV